eukprot:CAMPEP_0202698926 /NCGR_PEP_ID=MMETSP1385-20130828/12161_1 /ASSEMBLY_ACC=CAM_ASM_000861 /TAXON_ID=933848 /ORGANISM="Elphidium margaritaceum" /LENGTH=128 /DNA_ID=CAMNT_0049355755 /DNA_START=428 /DNA_END=814 /DNA_ORIENTATION=-
MADPLRHVLGDNELWPSCARSCHELWPSHCRWSSNQYKCALVCGETFDPPFDATLCAAEPVSCTCVHDSQENMAHLSTVGFLFTIVCTYVGFILFMTGNLWNANIIDKCRDIKHKYRVLRGYSFSSDE